MAVYEYTGINSQGKKVSGSLNADNSRALRDQLKSQGIFLTDARESKGGQRTDSRDIQLPWANRVSTQDVALMTRLLATQQRAGISLSKCLEALVDQTESLALRTIIQNIHQDVTEGQSLYDAMRKHPKAFSSLYLNMIRAGESSGNLDLVLLRLSEFLEDQSKLQGKVTGALAYPVMMVFVTILIVSFMMVSVVPKITDVYADQGQALPFITRLLIGVSSFIGSWRVLILFAVIGGAVFYFRRWLSTKSGRLQWDAFVLKVPLIGNMLRMLAMARFSRTLSTLLSSGVEILKALDIVKNILGNTVLVGVVEDAVQNVKEGESLAKTLKASGEFPPMMTHMLAIGEQTGALEEMLANVADTYETQVNQKVEAFTSLLEPVMIVGMGGSVGFIVFAIIQPIFQLSSSAF